MHRRIVFVLALTLVTAAATPVFAVELALPYIKLWASDKKHTFQTENLLSLELPGASTVGLPAGASTTTTSARDTNDMITSTQKSVLSIYPVTGGKTPTITLSPNPVLTSAKNPDPTVAKFQCGGSDETDYDTNEGNNSYLGCPCPSGSYGEGQCFNPSDTEFPDEEMFNIGIANAGSSTVLVYGDAYYGRYQIGTEAQVDIGVYTAYGYNATTGAKLWTQTFPSTDSTGYKIEPVLSGVAAFHKAGTDELRVGAILKTKTGQSFRYEFYNIVTGALVATETEIVTATTP